MTEFYQPLSGITYTEENLRAKTGLSPDADPSYLAANGVYTIDPTPNPIDTNLYVADPVYTIVGYYAEQSWVATPLPLPEAKANGTLEVQNSAALAVSEIISQSGYSAEVLSAAGAMAEVDRPAVYQTVIAEQQVVTDQLAVNVDLINSATSVDEIDSILQQPSGTFVSGRGGAGPNDMNPSYFTVLNNLPPGIGEPELEIYIPGTDTVIPYNASLPAPYKFDSMGNCYNTDDYRTTIRIAATGQVLSTVTPAFGANVPIAWTYNPVIPSLGGGGGSSEAF